MSRALRILHLEDNPDYSELVKGMLKEAGLSVEIVLVGNHADFTAALEREAFDLILGDFKLPTCTGLQALETARLQRPDTPFILVSGTIGESAAIESLKHGATDYVLKQWPERLVPAVRRAVQEALEHTRRKRAEAELVRREKYFRALTENSLDILSILNRDGVFQYNSPSVQQVLGYPPAELAGRNAFELVHPEDLPGAMRAFAQGLQHPERRITHECRYHRADGSWCHLEVVGQNHLDEPDIAGVVLNSRDVTERRRAESALRKSEEQNRALINAIPDLLFQINRDGLILSYRAQDESDLYVPPEMFLGKRLQDVMPLPVSERAMKAIAAALSSKKVLVFEYELEVGSEQRFYESRIVPLSETEVLSVARNITERKRAEAHLRLQSAALASAANAIVITDRDGHILWTNPAFTRMTGYTVEEVLGQNPRLLKSGQHDQPFYKNLWDTILAGRVWRSEMVNRRKDGSLYTEESTITPVRNERADITHFIAVKQDITARKELEAALRQAQKMEAIGQLAGGVAHDFNNILTVIHGYASLQLMTEGISGASATAAQQIAMAAERAAGLTRQLLAFSRRQLMQPRLLNLNHIVSNLAKMLGRILGEDITLQLTYPAQSPLVEADAGMLEQVLLNLAVNARDAMPKGGQLGIRISVARLDAHDLAQHPEGRAGAFVCLSVTDTGCGIAPEILPRIFEPFFTTKEVGRGTGLGLATVFGIVKQHLGWVEVESEPGKGTNFRVFLPACAEVAVQTGDKELPLPVRGGGEAILVVEDETPVRELACNFLQGIGYTILAASAAAEALNLWQQRKSKIDLLLTDLIMPGPMNGWELAKTLWADRPDLKVIFASGYGVEVVGKEFALEHGRNFLQKPYNPEQLASIVRDSLDSARSRSAADLRF